MRDPDILLIEGSDFESFPAGGQLTMARAMMKLFGERLALVGVNRNGEPSGTWQRKNAFGKSFRFFPVCARELSWKRPLLPARYTFYAGLRRYRGKILDSGCTSAFIQTPEAIMEASRWGLKNLCYWFAGVENPLIRSRYRFARPFSHWFDRSLFDALKRANLILAAADEAAIQEFVRRSRGRITRDRIIQFPTCVDLREFFSFDKDEARKILGLPIEPKIFACIGRIGRLKGWELLVDAFEEFLLKNGDARLLFVGDGEDKPDLIERLGSGSLSAKVVITGFQSADRIRLYLNAADVVVSGSHLEGWSVSMLEALACGKALVSTAVSGAGAMIEPGANGFIVQNRDAREFAHRMERALQLRDATSVSLNIAERFDIAGLGQRLTGLWPPLRGHQSADDSRAQVSAN